MEKFKILECTHERIWVNRPPQNTDELMLMRVIAMEAITRHMLETNDNLDKTINKK